MKQETKDSLICWGLAVCIGIILFCYAISWMWQK